MNIILNTLKLLPRYLIEKTGMRMKLSSVKKAAATYRLGGLFLAFCGLHRDNVLSVFMQLQSGLALSHSIFVSE